MTGQELRRIREAHGLSQSALAALLGYAQSHIAMLERGQRTVQPRFERLIKKMLPIKKPIDKVITQ